jgi:hypothetical protein
MAHVMRKHRLLLAAAVGLLSAAVAWFWPAAPLWERTLPARGRVLHFGPDDRVIYTEDEGHVVSHSGMFSSRPGARHLWRWDAQTGELLETISVPVDAGATCIDMRLSPDGHTLLLDELGPKAGKPLVWTWYLFDLTTRRRQELPPGDVAHYHPQANFSSDGRWVWVDHRVQLTVLDGIDIVETATGRRAVRLREQNGELPIDGCFAPDGSAIAVHWFKPPTSAALHFVSIVELPTAAERRRFPLPPQPWLRLNEWLGDRVYAQANVPNGPVGYYLLQTYSFDVAAESIGEGRLEPLLSGQVNGNEGGIYWDHGPGWVASLTLDHREPGRWERWLGSVAAKLGVKYRAEPGPFSSVRFLDPETGRTRSELPGPLTFPCVISHDAKRVASVQSGDTLQVWDANPSPRWPWVVSAGVVGSGSILLLGNLARALFRRRSKRLCPARDEDRPRLSDP